MVINGHAGYATKTRREMKLAGIRSTLRSDNERPAPGFVLGVAAGWVMSPLFALVSFARRARTFHPRGPTFHATVAVDRSAPAELQRVAARLQGSALVRFSGALWKHAQSIPDVLGCAIRFRRGDTDDADADADDQDLLFATIRRPWTMPFSPLTTKVRDYLANDYFAVSPFDAGVGRQIYLRLRPDHPCESVEGSRGTRLVRQVELGRADLHLEASDAPFGPWTSFASVSLERPANIDGEALRFRPFRAGRGVRPRGFIHALRVGVYSMSQTARPAHSA